MRAWSPSSNRRHIDTFEGPEQSGPFFYCSAAREVDSGVATLHSVPMVDAIGAEELERRALQLEKEQRVSEARDAFDDALRLNPNSQSAAEGRARVALALSEASAANHCARALAFRDNDPEMQVRMIVTAAGQIGSGAIPLFKAFLDRNPENVLAQEMMADLLAQSGAGDGFLDVYKAALAKQPTNKALLKSYWDTLSRARRYSEALESMDANRKLFDGDRAFVLLEVNLASYAGLTDRASELLETLDNQADAQLARGLNQLQKGEPEDAAGQLESVVQQEPDNFEAWSLLEIAWRMISDPRHEWLIGMPPLYGSQELDLGKAQLDEIANMLRGMHQASAQPIGQSLRGGTQTPGQLFDRSGPEMSMLTAALAFEIRQFVDKLPPEDRQHPLLKHRNMGMAFGPSWSVRFTGSGHHAAHFHPGGILSSACYICVPEALADEKEKPGWLEIGRPPPELGLDLEPLATFEPKPGRLVLFPSFLFHGTRPFSGGERMSVAFDLVPVSMS